MATLGQPRFANHVSRHTHIAFEAHGHQGLIGVTYFYVLLLPTNDNPILKRLIGTIRELDWCYMAPHGCVCVCVCVRARVHILIK